VLWGCGYGSCPLPVWGGGGPAAPGGGGGGGGGGGATSLKRGSIVNYVLQPAVVFHHCSPVTTSFEHIYLNCLSIK
jgi:hypothetical protein